MPASSTKELFAFENHFERAVESILKAAGYPAVFTTAAQGVLPESRLEVTFSLGDTLNEHTLDSGQRVYDYFNASLQIRVCTERPADRPSLIPGVARLHEEFCAGVRAALEERDDPFDGLLPYYEVRTIRPRPTSRGLDTRWLEDFTQLEFLVEFGIRSDAWPA
jgi:hypothetical protein